MLDKKAFLNNYQYNNFFMINSNNQEPIRCFDCFGRIFYDQSKTKT